MPRLPNPKLLAEKFVKLTEHDQLSRETVRQHLSESDLKPWRKDMWCIPKVDAKYVARTEDVRQVVCFEESPTQFIDEVRRPIPAAPGRLERCECEYKCNGTANLFVFLHYTPKHAGWLNMAEIEVGVLHVQCLDCRIESRDRLAAEVVA